MSTPNFTQFKYSGINIPSNTTSLPATAGDISYNSTVNKFAIYTTASSYLVTENTVGSLGSTITPGLSVFTSSTQGVVPASGGGTANFLRADGTWDSPSGSGSVTSVAMTVPSFLSVSGSPITSTGTLAVTLSGTALPLSNGGTGETSAAAAFAILSPMASAGDMIYNNSSAVATKLPIGSTGQVLTVSAGEPVWSTSSSFTPRIPLITIVTSGSGTYTTPTSPSPLYLEIEMVGGGGGGAGGGSGVAGSNGTSTTFGTSLLVAGGGTGGNISGAGATGGTASLGGATGIAIAGASGDVENSSGGGGNSPFGGAGGAGVYTLTAGQAAAVNSGSGGGSGAGPGSPILFGGGGAGGYVKAYITSSIQSTYSYVVGALGAGGSASTNSGGNGGAGLIIVKAYYQ